MILVFWYLNQKILAGLTFQPNRELLQYLFVVILNDNCNALLASQGITVSHSDLSYGISVSRC
jgi:hypothetical protein